jgi:hypothetical protein
MLHGVLVILKSHTYCSIIAFLNFFTVTTWNHISARIALEEAIVSSTSTGSLVQPLLKSMLPTKLFSMILLLSTLIL